MDKLDRRILKLVQEGFPLSKRPYDTLARQLKISSNQLFERIQKMRKNGLIRRIGISLDSRKIGFCSTLAAVSVLPADVKKAAEIISRFPEVTHSYLRKDAFNIWFTIIAADKKRIERILKQIRCDLSLKNSQVLNLPVKRLFKLDARFNVTT